MEAVVVLPLMNTIIIGTKIRRYLEDVVIVLGYQEPVLNIQLANFFILRRISKHRYLGILLNLNPQIKFTL
jgi:hypothetical protein